MNTYQPVIGLEIHVELKTKSKMFCQCDADWFGKEPNTHTCPVCLGLPGALPVANQKAVEWTIKISKALNCAINKHSKFDRKHYFYPDIPKGYQISQYDKPIGEHGYIDVGYPETKKFRIRRVHLEEDTGKLMHEGNDTLIDFNRSSVPLVEIVTEPDFDNSDDVKKFLEELHTIIRYLDVSDADMEKGSMRMEPNISVKEIRNPKSEAPNEKNNETMKQWDNELPPYKVEVKNINSFNFVKLAVDYEIKRHIELLEEGKIPVQETRGYNSDKKSTYSQRVKEEAADYRYFPDPDLPPMVFTDEYLEGITVSELPSQKVIRYCEELKIKPVDAAIITRDKQLVALFEDVLKEADKDLEPQKIVNLIINKKIPTNISAKEFIAKAKEMSKPKETDTALLTSVIEKVLAANEKSVTDYKSGKTNAIMFLMGQVMKEMKGQADAATVKAELEKKLK